MDNYLAAEGLIIERLRGQVAAVKHVLSAADLAGVREEGQLHPAVHVIYAGDRLGRSGGEGQAQSVFQRWYALVAVKNARTPRTGEHARADAGALILAVIRALSGWSPSPEHGPLIRENAPPPNFSAGFVYFPLLFSTEIATLGNPE